MTLTQFCFKLGEGVLALLPFLLRGYVATIEEFLTFRSPDTFEVLSTIPVTLEGAPLDRLNELECVGGDVYANVWLTDTIVRIDKQTGQVTAQIDARGLLPPDQRPASTDAVLNGIAYDPANDTFLVTGKLWPRLFEVQFVP